MYLYAHWCLQPFALCREPYTLRLIPYTLYQFIFAPVRQPLTLVFRSPECIQNFDGGDGISDIMHPYDVGAV